MTTPTDIANLALGKLGEARIADLLDGTRGADAMSARYPHARRAMLSSTPWRFAVRVVMLPALGGSAPASGYARAFTRPGDDLKPLMVGDEAAHPVPMVSARQGRAFRVVGTQIHTDLAAPLRYEYVSDLTPEAEFPAEFVEALACRLAADAARELTQSSAAMQEAAAGLASALRDARRSNMLWSPPVSRRTGPWLASRHG